MTPDEQIAEVLRDFDFAKVARAMDSLGWYWQDKRPPTPDELRDSAKVKLQYAAIPTSTGYLASGGLVARRDADGGLSLSFEVETAYAK